MKKLAELLKQNLSAGTDTVLVTVVASSGSTPRGAGARMLVTEKGRIYGTIGGGAVEYKSEQVATDVLKRKRSLIEKYSLRPNDVADLGMICGGAVDVYFHFIPGGDRDGIIFADSILKLYGSDENAWLICDVTEGSDGAVSVYGSKSGVVCGHVPDAVISSLSPKPDTVGCGENTYFCEEFSAPGRVYVFGGGHVAQALVPVLAGIGFRCTVIDDRPEFASPSLFPSAEGTMLVTPDEYPAIAERITASDYVCVMTRGHKNDYDVQRAVLRSPAKYIGVIGSRHKSAAVFARLREEDGYTDDDCARVTTPIGLDIGAETPAEIAVSIAAQMIAVRSGRGAK